MYSSYFVFWYFSFLFFSIFVPLIFIYFSDFDFSLTSMSFYLAFLKDYKYLIPVFNFFYSNDYFFFGFFLFKMFYKFIYIFFHLYVLSTFLLVGGFLKYYVMQFFYFFISFLSLYCFFLIKFFKNVFLFVVFIKYLFSSFDWGAIISIFKNFLFSDNFIILLLFVLKSIFKYLISVFFNFFSFLLYIITKIIYFILPDYLGNFLSLHFSFLLDFFLIKFYSFLITILDLLIILLSTYFKDLTFFGFAST